MNLFRGNSQDFHALFTRFSWPKPRVFSWVQPMKIPLKKPWKYFGKFTINGSWNSLDYKKCNEKHMKKPWLFFSDSWIWLVMVFSWCSRKVHEIYSYFSRCANSWQFNGMENSWVTIIPLTENFQWAMKILRVLFWPFHSIFMAYEMYFVPDPPTFSWVKVMAKWYHENGIKTPLKVHHFKNYAYLNLSHSAFYLI